MSPEPEVVILPTAAALAQEVADRLIHTLVAVQADHPARLVLTGGGVGIATLQALREHPERDRIDWAAIQLWWGDERYLPAQDAQRNDLQARQALLDHVNLTATHVHPMPVVTPDSDLTTSASLYDHQVEQALRAGQRPFDVVLLGVGPDGHVASLFPGQPLPTSGRWAIPVAHSPKPPPQRISLTPRALCCTRQVWLLAAGQQKAAAVAASLRQQEDLPASHVHGQEHTYWWLDRSAAGELT